MSTPRPPHGAPTAAGPPCGGPPRDGLPRDDLPRDDLAAALAARRELGPDYDAAFAEAVVDRVEQALDARLGPRPAGRAAGWAARPADMPGVTLVVASLLAAIPLSAIGVANAGMPGLLTVWTAIVLINVVHALRPRP
ncbi:hypothetical protein Acsp04_19920 [Actinomadura sp. NBRC 104425]|uniref:hypothetical protein n=1 Tax=Actinomadura sp. NBRC 104425 TaxID=3032204 RepID=UPI0024A3BC3D|nr:hypothetical protein [Actinomadura sp. NBRC 104425]GLZ11757.1 hypothetical protein Acsp04_19920 [Actinomadura sp. NBRC 104425]